MPAVGRDSINLSSKDVAAVAAFFTVGFLVRLTTVGFRVVFTDGAFGFDTVLVGRGRGVELLIGAGIAVELAFAPLPLRPSMTICPPWV